MQILSDIRLIIEETRNRVARSINHERTVTYWLIGQRIVEEEQHGRERATYGKRLVQHLSDNLTSEYGEGFSANNLWRMKDLYLGFPILDALRQELSWTHYRLLVKIENYDKRDFYIAEAIKNAWNVRQLERQINALLYERLLMSQDKETILAIAKGEAQPTHASQILRDPTVLEFWV